MASEHRSRDQALRELLVDQARGARSSRVGRRYSGAGGRQAAVVTAVVLVVVVALSIAALQIRGGEDPIAGGSPTATGAEGIPTPTLPAGPVLGRFSSTDGPDQNHTIRPDGLALATLFSCTGKGKWSTSIAHWGDSGGDGDCDGERGVTTGNKGVAGSTTVKIKTDPRMTWTFTVIGIPETYVTPRPVATPTDSSGIAVRYCTSDDLTARFQTAQMPDGVTEVSGGELEFSNRTSRTCALAGYPEVRFLSAGTALGHNTMNHTDERDSTEHGLKAVILQPGGRAYSQISWYLPNYYPENEEGTCAERTVTDVEVDLDYDLAAPTQIGTFTVPIGKTTACLNGQHGALGKYGQLSSTVFVDYTVVERD